MKLIEVVNMYKVNVEKIQFGDIFYYIEGEKLYSTDCKDWRNNIVKCFCVAFYSASKRPLIWTGGINDKYPIINSEKCSFKVLPHVDIYKNPEAAFLGGYVEVFDIQAKRTYVVNDVLDSLIKKDNKLENLVLDPDVCDAFNLGIPTLPELEILDLKEKE